MLLLQKSPTSWGSVHYFIPHNFLREVHAIVEKSHLRSIFDGLIGETKFFLRDLDACKLQGSSSFVLSVDIE